MPYNINFSTGTVIVQPNQIDDSKNITLIGRYITNYGQYLNQDLANLLQNFAGSSNPDIVKSVPGQLWYDTALHNLKVFNGTSYVPVVPVDPLGTVVGETILDNASPSVSHNVLSFYLVGTRVGIFSTSAEFTPAITISGFTTIKPGLNLNTTNGAVFAGTSTNSQKLAGYTALQFMRSDTDTTNSGNVTVTGTVTANTGVALDSLQKSIIRYLNNNLQVLNSTPSGQIIFTIADAGSVQTDILILDKTRAYFSLPVVTKDLIVSNSAVLGSNSHIYITGGLNGQVLTTDGTGNLSWSTPVTITVETLPTGDYGTLAGDYNYLNSAEYGTVKGYDMASQPKYGTTTVDLGGLV